MTLMALPSYTDIMHSRELLTVRVHAPRNNAFTWERKFSSVFRIKLSHSKPPGFGSKGISAARFKEVIHEIF